MKWRYSLFWLVFLIFSSHQVLIGKAFLTGQSQHQIRNFFRPLNLTISFLVFDQLEGYFNKTDYIFFSGNEEIGRYTMDPDQLTNQVERLAIRNIEKYGHDRLYIKSMVQYLFCNKKYSRMYEVGLQDKPVTAVRLDVVSLYNHKQVIDLEIMCNEKKY